MDADIAGVMFTGGDVRIEASWGLAEKTPTAGRRRTAVALAAIQVSRPETGMAEITAELGMSGGG